MEINTNPNYLNNIQNKNAQGANSATAENVVEENLFEDTQATEILNAALTQNYSNADFFTAVATAVTAIMAPFIQMMQQWMSTMNTEQQKTNEPIIDANNKETLIGFQNQQNDKDLLNDFQNVQNDKDLLKEYEATNQANKDSHAKIQAEIDILNQQKWELNADKKLNEYKYSQKLNDGDKSNDAAAEAQYQYESMNITTKEFQINHQLELLNNALNAANQKSDNPHVQELLDKKAELLSKKVDITKDYTSALNDKTLTFDVIANMDTGSKRQAELTYENFCAMPDSQYRLVNPKTGKILCLNANEAENYNTSTNNMEVMPDLKNKAYFQELLQSGQVVIQKKEQFGANQTWNAVPFKSIPDINTAYNTENDAAAEANYQFQLLQIESELAKVDMELKNAQATASNTIPADTLQSGLQDGTMQVTNTGNGFTITETNTQTETVQNDKQNYVERQIERYEKYIAKYEKQIEILESGNDSNKEAKIASLEQKIEKYMSKIQELID